MIETSEDSQKTHRTRHELTANLGAVVLHRGSIPVPHRDVVWPPRPGLLTHTKKAGSDVVTRRCALIYPRDKFSDCAIRLLSVLPSQLGP